MAILRPGPLLSLCVLLAALALRLFDIAASRAHDMPWTPLSLSDPVGRFTVLKISRLHGDPNQCHALLDNVEVSYTMLPPVDGQGTCGYRNGVLLSNRGDVAFAPPMGAACPIAASLFIWQVQSVSPAAYHHFRQPVVRIETFGTYSCRTIGNAEGRAMSEHATANAIDIAAFRLSDGRRISVAGHWDDNSPSGRFLRDVRDGACRVFATTLSPDYNAAHQDHMHLDQARRGGWSFCR